MSELEDEDAAFEEGDKTVENSKVIDDVGKAMGDSSEKINEALSKGTATKEQINELIENMSTYRKKITDSSIEAIEKAYKMKPGGVDMGIADIINTKGNPTTYEGRALKHMTDKFSGQFSEFMKSYSPKKWYQTFRGKLGIVLVILSISSVGEIIRHLDPTELQRCFKMKTCPNITTSDVVTALPCPAINCSCPNITKCDSGQPTCNDPNSECIQYFFDTYTLRDIIAIIPTLPSNEWDAENTVNNNTKEFTIKIISYIAILIATIVTGYMFFKWYVKHFSDV